MEFKDKIGSYKLLFSLGKGGMGEVFLASDSVCGRKVALKQIRHDLIRFKSIQDRFLREARIAAQLVHPSIIPIYSINQEKNLIYYTMPYVEGDTLKQILRTARDQEKNGEPLHPIGGSIPTLARIFLNVCQAIAYSHSKGILHRDIKPENIIVGKYGEVLILDWGLAEFIEDQQEEENEEIPSPHNGDLTRPGKIVGTLAYMTPERVQGEKASILTDIYALGVILYQMLTLRLPFKRETVESFRKTARHERLIDPSERAPYRDIPRPLADSVQKCLAYDKEARYQRVEELIADIENYIEGRPEWLLAQELNIDDRRDWEFQENVLLAKHIAITRGTEVMEWVSLMISRASFSGNTKLEASVRLGEMGSGIGFLLSIPEASERKGVEDGYCLWIGSAEEPSCRLFRSNIEVMHIPDVHLSPNNLHRIRIEKIDNHLRFYLDDSLKFDYISRLPLIGTHVGLLYRDADFEIKDFKISVGSQNVMVNCLAVPDAFLAHKNYQTALAEYRRISNCFPGRAEGREAAFRAGVTLLEKALDKKKKGEKETLFHAALEEFGKLHATPGAPLEYLGKSLVYKACDEIEEEIKCLELAVRKYAKHPLLPTLVEHIVFRLHESAYHDRLAAYHFALLALRHLPHIFVNPDNQKLIESLKRHWEPLPFLYHRSDFTGLAVELAFWLAKPITLVEIIDNSQGDAELVNNALCSLWELGCKDWIKQHFPDFKHSSEIPPIEKFLWEKQWNKAADLFEQNLEAANDEKSPLYPLFGCYLMATECEEIALAHFSRGTENSYPPTTALLGHYLLKKISLKNGWIDRAFFWEKVQLLRQLILFYHCADQPKNVDFYKRKLNHELNRVLSFCPAP